MQPAWNIPSYPDTGRFGAFTSARISFSIALLSAGFAGINLPAAAQLAEPAPQAAAPSPDAIKQREQELEATRTLQKSAAEFSRSSRPKSRRSDRTAASSTAN